MATKRDMAEETDKAARAALALMHSSNVTLKRERDDILKAAEALLASDLGKAFAELQAAVHRAKTEIPF